MPSKQPIPLLKRGDLPALRRAIEEFKTWRGALVGNPDPRPLEEFDASVARAQLALKRVEAMHLFCKSLTLVTPSEPTTPEGEAS